MLFARNFMSFSILLAILLAIVGFVCRIWLKNDRKLPPGPRSLPIIGNLHMIGKLKHQDLAKLAKRFGPIMYMKLGSVPTIVVSSPEAAKLFLMTHDKVFANRPNIQASNYIFNSAKGVVFANYGSCWRNGRKLCISNLLGPSKMKSSASGRMREVKTFVSSLKTSLMLCETVNMNTKLEQVLENLALKLVLGYTNYDKFDPKDLIKDALGLAGEFNISDYFPYLAPFDIQGIERRMKRHKKEIDEFLEKIIVEHEKNLEVENNTRDRDFIDILLTLTNQPTNISTGDDTSPILDRSNIKAILMDLIIGAHDAAYTGIIWTFSELLRNPGVMKKLRDEFETTIGLNRMIEESDFVRISRYLDYVIMESMRLHPVAPFLLPHESAKEITINDYYIPEKSFIIINTWAIGRDPNVWTSNVNEFLPERFEKGDIGIPDKDFRLIPFGSGRRGCPGMDIGMNTIRLIVAQLVHCFNWELPNGMLPCELDMSEGPGMNLPRAVDLLAVPVSYRLLA